MSLRSPEKIEIAGHTLADILSAHAEWVQSGSQRGTRADLEAVDLRRVDLGSRDLRLAKLNGADLQGSDLSRARLNGADLRETNLRNANLSNADLTDQADPPAGSDATAPPIPGDVPTQTAHITVGGADLTIARLPKRLNPERALERCRASATGVRLAGGAAAALFCVVIIYVLTTRDYQLLRGALPPASWFEVLLSKGAAYQWGPPLLLGVFFFWHRRFLNPLWKRGADLPALFPDGTSLDSKASLWPLTTIAGNYMPRLRDEEAAWPARALFLASEIALWWLGPFVLLLVWWRYLSVHEWAGTVLQLAAVTLSVALAAESHCSARLLFCPQAAGKSGLQQPASIMRRPAIQKAAAAVILLTPISFASIEGNLGKSLPVSANVSFQDLSVKPVGSNRDELDRVRGVNLRGRNLRYAKVSYSFLAKADLRQARMDGAAVTISDLRGANLEGANLRSASLFSSNLEGAVLDRADLRGASLVCAKNLIDQQLAAAVTDESTLLPDGSTGPFQPGKLSTLTYQRECENWEPGQVPRLPIPTPGGFPKRPQRQLPEPDLSPIPELVPRKKP